MIMNPEFIIGAVIAAVGAAVGGYFTAILTVKYQRDQDNKDQRAQLYQKYKMLYIKAYHFSDRTTGTPIYTAFVNRLKREVQVYDEFHTFDMNIFNKETEELQINQTSSGIVDYKLLYPPSSIENNNKNTISRDEIIEGAINKKSAIYCGRGIRYNGFQKGNTDQAIKMLMNVTETKLIVDFTSVPKHADIFKVNQAIRLSRKQLQENITEYVDVSTPGVFSLSQMNLEKDDIIRIDFDVDWSLLPSVEKIGS